MTFSTCNKFVEVVLNQSSMSWCAVINCNNKTKNKREVSYFGQSKNTSVHKDWIHAKFLNSYSQKQTEHVYSYAFEFLHDMFC